MGARLLADRTVEGPPCRPPSRPPGPSGRGAPPRPRPKQGGLPAGLWGGLSSRRLEGVRANVSVPRFEGDERRKIELARTSWAPLEQRRPFGDNVRPCGRRTAHAPRGFSRAGRTGRGGRRVGCEVLVGVLGWGRPAGPCGRRCPRRDSHPAPAARRGRGPPRAGPAGAGP